MKDVDARAQIADVLARIRNIEVELDGYYVSVGLRGRVMNLEDHLISANRADNEIRERMDALLAHLGVEIVLNEPQKWVVRKVGE